MARSRRIDIPDGRYHVFNRGANRQPIFLSDGDRVEFGRLLAEACEMFGIKVLAYCLMGNHYHLVIHCPDGGLSEAMHRIAFIFTKHFNERHERDGPLFRGRFASIVIDDDAYLLTAFRYVHRNPLAMADVDDVADYRWSSMRAYLGLRTAPDFLAVDDVLAYFDGDRQRMYRFVSSDERPRQRTATPHEVHALIQLAVADATLGDSGSGAQPWLGRTAMTALLDKLPGPLADELFETLGRPSPRAQQRAATRLGSDPIVDAVFGVVTSQLGLAS